MLERTVTVLLLIIAAIHLLPILGFLGAERISSLYQVELADRNIEILMRHRAVLFGILGAFFAYAAFNAPLQLIAFTMASISIVAFLYLGFSVGDYNAAIRTVIIADVFALVCLVGAISAYWFKAKNS